MWLPAYIFISYLWYNNTKKSEKKAFQESEVKMKKQELENKLNRLVKESYQELKTIPDNTYQLINKQAIFTINYRAKTRLGQCVGKKAINISSWLLEYGTDKDIKNTIIHELLHTIEKCKGHDYLWKSYADIVNYYLDYHISRCTDTSNIKAGHNELYVVRKDNYEIKCKKCGDKFYKNRITKRILMYYKHNNMRHKKCGGNEFEILDLRTGSIICSN